MSDHEVFCHLMPGAADMVPRGMVHDVTWFGVDRPDRTLANPAVPMPGWETVMLDDALVIPTPFAILDAAGALRHGVMPSHIAEPIAVHPGTGVLAPLAAGADEPLGRFLGETLSIASLQCRAGGVPGLIGAPLTLAQIDALAAMNLLDRYTPIATPTRIARLCLTRPVGSGVSRMIRPAIESLRFMVEPYEVSARIAILAPADEARFTRANQASVLAWLRARGFAVLDVAAMRLGVNQLGLTDLVASLAASRVIVIDDPAQAPLLGFCDPGTMVLELGIDGWRDTTIAACARMFGLEWRLILSPAPRYPVRTALPLGERHMLQTEVDIAALARGVLRAETALASLIS
ncbi:hypothetical protein [Acidiphilium sp.]|uniref:hypothetical protein n=1 Tax=Acidiphilium sp. TaxID=527 RepID=UPI003D03CC55